MFSAGCSKKESIEPKSLLFNNTSTILAEMPVGAAITDVYFSSDGNYVATAVKKTGGEYLSINGSAGALYDTVKRPEFNKGFAGYAYEARKGNKSCVVLDGNESAWYDAVDRIFFTRDGHVLYAAKKGTAWILRAGSRKRPLSGELSFPMEESPDGKRLIYLEMQGETNKTAVNVCDPQLRSCEKSRAYDYAVSVKHNPGLSHLAFVSKGPEKSVLVVLDLASSVPKETISAEFDAILIYSISDNGRHVALLGRRGDKYILLKDGHELPMRRIGAAFDMSVAGSGSVFYTVFENRKVRAFVDGKQFGKDYESITFPMFSPDARDVLFIAQRNGKSFLVVNGMETAAFDKIVSPHFSSDGTRVVYRARHGNRRFVVVADAKGRTIKEYARYEAVWNISFSPDGQSIGYGVKDGNKLVWKVEKLL